MDTSSMKKISKDKDVEPTEFEQSDTQPLFDLENTHQELICDSKDQDINSASKIDVSSPSLPIAAGKTNVGRGAALSFDEIEKRLEGVYVYGIANSEQIFVRSWDDDSVDSHLNMYFSEKVAKKRLKELKLNDPEMYADYKVSPYVVSDESNAIFLIPRRLCNWFWFGLSGYKTSI